MDKQKITEFFDACAPTWDAEMIKDDGIISSILDAAGVTRGTRVLDVACGTGVLFEHYLARGAQLTGIDISPEMVRIAREKFPEVPVICGDAEEAEFPDCFDAVVVYNAFPHFPDPHRILCALSKILLPGGRLTVAHGMSRDQINRHHSGSASAVSRGLMPAEELAKMLPETMQAVLTLDANDRYILCAVQK